MRQDKENMGTGSPLEKEKVVGSAWTAQYLGDDRCAAAHSSAIPTKAIAVRKAQVEKWFCGIQQTLKWNNILLSVLKKKSTPLKIFPRRIYQVGPIQLYNTRSCKTLTCIFLFFFFLFGMNCCNTRACNNLLETDLWIGNGEFRCYKLRVSYYFEIGIYFGKVKVGWSDSEWWKMLWRLRSGWIPLFPDFTLFFKAQNVYIESVILFYEYLLLKPGVRALPF